MSINTHSAGTATGVPSGDRLERKMQSAVTCGRLGWSKMHSHPAQNDMSSSGRCGPTLTWDCPRHTELEEFEPDLERGVNSTQLNPCNNTFTRYVPVAKAGVGKGSQGWRDKQHARNGVRPMVVGWRCSVCSGGHTLLLVVHLQSVAVSRVQTSPALGNVHGRLMPSTLSDS